MFQWIFHLVSCSFMCFVKLFLEDWFYEETREEVRVSELKPILDLNDLKLQRK